MKVSEQRKGFSLVEVVMAMTITAVSLTMLFATQGRLLQQGARSVSSWRAMVTLKNIFVEAAEQNEQRTEQIERLVDGVTANYTLKKIDERSALKDVKNVRLAHGVARWNVFGFEQRDVLVGAVATAPEQPAAKGNV